MKATAVLLALVCSGLVLIGPAVADDGPDFFYLDESYHSLLSRKGTASFVVMPRYYNVKGMFYRDGNWNSLGKTSRKHLTLGWNVDFGDRIGLGVYTGVVRHRSRYNPGTGLGETWGRLKLRPLAALPLCIRLAARDPGDLDLRQDLPLTRAVDLSVAWEQSARLWALNLFAGYRKRISATRFEPGDEIHALAELALRQEVNGLSAGFLGHYGFNGRFDGAEAAETDGYLLTGYLRYFSSITPRTWTQLSFLYDMMGMSRIGGFVFSVTLGLHV